MNTTTFHSKLLDLQGQAVSGQEEELLLSQLRNILNLKRAGHLTNDQAAAEIRKLAWSIAEDLRMDDLDLSSGTDETLVEELPRILETSN